MSNNTSIVGGALKKKLRAYVADSLPPTFHILSVRLRTVVTEALNVVKVTDGLKVIIMDLTKICRVPSDEQLIKRIVELGEDRMISMTDGFTDYDDDGRFFQHKCK